MKSDAEQRSEDENVRLLIQKIRREEIETRDLEVRAQALAAGSRSVLRTLRPGAEPVGFAR